MHVDIENSSPKTPAPEYNYSGSKDDLADGIAATAIIVLAVIGVIFYLASLPS